MQCPSCHNSVTIENKDIGALFTCPSCMSVYFINFDGTPDYSEGAIPTEEEVKALQQTIVAEDSKSPTHSFEHSVDSGVEEPLSEASSVHQPDSFFLNMNAEIQNNEKSISNNSNVSNQTPEQTISDSSNMFQNMTQEIEAFGNQQTVIAGLSYDLSIAQIDTKESMELLKEALDDSKFGWLVDDFVKEIKTGHLTLKNLTPVQAFVLARRIQFIDVEIKWTQNAAV